MCKKKTSKPQETKPLKKRGNISKIMGCWLFLLIGVGFCIMRKETKLESLLQSAQKKETTTDEDILKFEKELNKEIHAMNKKDEISDQFYCKMRLAGGTNY